ncbi:MAG TPA: hypothetical protein ACQGQH_05870 [Xylella sp.]
MDMGFTAQSKEQHQGFFIDGTVFVMDSCANFVSVVLIPMIYSRYWLLVFESSDQGSGSSVCVK